ncbi:hypothetical protein PFISCL1PPCAC_14586 [Pristionchus fissidentatus]|uniref:Uncharacterized protein n=1 Tax=Pristionchus fissidentatus TaxID=1538716 RepID=A0AAV5W015_9BILA|nr:hypothetical protein PFISCL1PPCAC_14586 [Pristionchus fissidentatus]
MGLLPRAWCLLVLALFVSTVSQAALIDKAIHLQIVSALPEDTESQSIIDKITVLASNSAAVRTLNRQEDKCFSSEDKENVGLILITYDPLCQDTMERRLVIIYNKTDTQLTNKGVPFNLSDKNGPIADLAGSLRDDSSDSTIPIETRFVPIKTSDSSKDEKSGVPIWVVVLMGIIIVALVIVNGFFFLKLRKVGAKPPRTVESSGKSGKSGKSHKSSKSGKSGKSSKSTASVKKSDKDSKKSGSSKRSKKNSSSKSRSSKSKSKTKVTVTAGKAIGQKNCSNEVPTSVKVVSVRPKREAASQPKDEITTTMLMTLPERTLEKRVEMPMTEEEFMQAMRKVIEFVVDFYRSPNKYPVSTAIRPNEIFAKLPNRAPDNPENFTAVWNDFNQIILNGCVHWQHPQFHAFFPCGRSYPDILAETLISALGTVGFTWSANPAITELDTAMVNWMGRALGIPESFLFNGNDPSESPGGGLIADTASDAIFCAIMAARHVKVEQELAKLGKIEDEIEESIRHTSKKYAKKGEIISKLVAYGSYESHSSFEKACKMALVRCRPIKVYEKDDWGMRREEVEKEMEKDVQRGLIPFYLHCALGTTSTATSDHLKELTPLREKYGVWAHVDAAYAGSAWVVPAYRNNEGLDKVDSININLHKFFLTSTSVTVFWTTRQKDYKACFRIDPAYLKKKSGANDLRDWGIQLSRRFKSLKVYMLLRMYGLNGMRAYITRLIKMTEYMESHVVKLPNIRKFGKTNYALFCVQYYKEGMNPKEVNTATNRLCEFVNNSHKMVLTHSNVRGHDIIRFCVTLERSTEKDINESLVIFKALLDAFEKKRQLDANKMDDMSSASKANLLQDVDMGIVGSPNLTLSMTATSVQSTVSGESLVGPKPAASISHISAVTSVTQGSTQMSGVQPSAPVAVTNVSAVLTTQQPQSAAPAAAAASVVPAAAAEVPVSAAPAAASAAQMMPPLTPPAFDGKDSSSKSGSSYNAPAPAPVAAPVPSTPPPAAEKPPTVSAPEVTAKSENQTEPKKE